MPHRFRTLLTLALGFCAISFVALPVAAADTVEGRIVVKLTAAAAARADALPLNDLPLGLPELDRLRGPLQIAGGFRVIRKSAGASADPQLFRDIGFDRLYVIEAVGMSADQMRTAIADLNRQPWVEYAEPDYVAKLTATSPNDPRFVDQWAHNNVGQSGGTIDADIDSVEAWDLSTGSAAGVVAIVDTGTDLDHPDLVANLVPGYDTLNEDNDPDDDNGHGTGTAGIAAARGNNGIGGAGVCWNCGIMPIKAFSAAGMGSGVDVAEGMVFAADNGADAISMSLGVFWSQAMVDASNYATGVGALCFGSAGNSGEYTGFAPAALPDCVSVGGTDDNDERLYSYGDHTELTAPSEVLTTALGGGDFENFDGTSASCPFAAGLAALLRSADPMLHVNELRHLLRLGADDGVGLVGEDTVGWDPFMGYGRINSHNSLALIDGPWLALDRPHYVCGGDLTVALKDEAGGATEMVTLTGSIGGDTETVMVSPLTAGGYYEGSLPIAWAGVDGPVVVSDGVLDLQEGEIVTATRGGLNANAFLDCLKRVCFVDLRSASIAGDCDDDQAADPGEIWQVDAFVRNLQTEEFGDVSFELSSSDPAVAVLDGSATIASLPPVDAVPADDAVPDATRSFRFQILDTATPLATTDLQFTITGPGWASDGAACAAVGLPSTLTLAVHRDRGSLLSGWDFDGGSAMGWTHGVAHGDGDLPTCDTATWVDGWNDLPANDRSHSGSFSMRLGSGLTYASDQDAGLISPFLMIPAGGASIGFRLWLDAELNTDPFTYDGMVVEGKERLGSTWHYLDDATYNGLMALAECGDLRTPPFGGTDSARLFVGDGAGNGVAQGDSFDVEHLANLSQFAGQLAQVRFRFGADTFNSSFPQGAWIDTINLYGPFTADGWAGTAPTNVAGTAANCPTSYDLSWDAVPAAADFAIYRSALSCADALTAPSPLATAAGTSYVDLAANDSYFYAVEAREPGTGCGSVRECVPGGCACATAADATGLRAERVGGDVALQWDDPLTPGLSWNLYRNGTPNTAGWGAPWASGITDADAGTAGIQYVDTGAVAAGSPLFYLVTVVNGCGESPLR